MEHRRSTLPQHPDSRRQPIPAQGGTPITRVPPRPDEDRSYRPTSNPSTPPPWGPQGPAQQPTTTSPNTRPPSS